MKEFLLIFRGDYLDATGETAEEVKAITQKWMDWLSGIVAEGNLVSRGNRLENSGRVLKAGVTTDGPFCEIKEKLGGFIIVNVEDTEEAVTLAHGCPVLDDGGSVEIRSVYE